MICSICHRLFDPAKSESLPFCTPRCRQIDLGRWLSEGYSVPSFGTEDEEEDVDSPAVNDADDEDG